jgi:hypothetical protein
MSFENNAVPGSNPKRGQFFTQYPGLNPARGQFFPEDRFDLVVIEDALLCPIFDKTIISTLPDIYRNDFEKL